VETVATRRPDDVYIEFKRYAAGMVVETSASTTAG
jgi:hypothetical protein